MTRRTFDDLVGLRSNPEVWARFKAMRDATVTFKTPDLVANKELLALTWGAFAAMREFASGFADGRIGEDEMLTGCKRLFEEAERIHQKWLAERKA